MYFATVACDNSIPRLSNSPWMRGAPQSGLARLMLRMRSRTFRGMSGLPGRTFLLFQVQYRRKPLRCQAITVSGLTITRAERQPVHRRESQTHKRRSPGFRGSRLRPPRRRTLIWWRRARFSTCRQARLWKQEHKADRNERNTVRMGGRVAVGTAEHQRFQHCRSYW